MFEQKYRRENEGIIPNPESIAVLAYLMNRAEERRRLQNGNRRMKRIGITAAAAAAFVFALMFGFQVLGENTLILATFAANADGAVEIRSNEAAEIASMRIALNKEDAEVIRQELYQVEDDGTPFQHIVFDIPNEFFFATTTFKCYGKNLKSVTFENLDDLDFAEDIQYYENKVRGGKKLPDDEFWENLRTLLTQSEQMKYKIYTVLQGQNGVVKNADWQEIYPVKSYDYVGKTAMNTRGYTALYPSAAIAAALKNPGYAADYSKLPPTHYLLTAKYRFGRTIRQRVIISFDGQGKSRLTMMDYKE